MIAIEQLQPMMLAEIRLQDAQASELAHLDLIVHGHRLCQRGPAFVVRIDGRPVAAAGLAEIHPHHATAWAIIGEDAGPAMLAFTRAIRRVFAAGAYARIDMTVQAGFAAGQRWARMLGFRFACRLMKFGADASDHDLFERLA